MHAADYAVLISVLSLLASVLSVIVAFVAVTRDRHVVAAKSEAWNNGRNWVLTVTVVNAGKRPISIEFLSVTVPDMPTRKRDFFPSGNHRVDVGDSRSTDVTFPDDQLAMWNSKEELLASKIYVVDALGKKYAAPVREKASS